MADRIWILIKAKGPTTFLCALENEKNALLVLGGGWLKSAFRFINRGKIIYCDFRWHVFNFQRIFLHQRTLPSVFIFIPVQLKRPNDS